MLCHDLGDELITADPAWQTCVMRGLRSVVALLGLGKEGGEMGNFLHGGQEFTIDEVQFYILEKQPSEERTQK